MIKSSIILTAICFIALREKSRKLNVTFKYEISIKQVGWVTDLWILSMNFRILDEILMNFYCYKHNFWALIKA